MKTIIIGQAPSRETEGQPAFSGRSGPRFAELLDVPHEKLWDTFEVFNLIDFFPGSADGGGDKFPVFEAKKRATELKYNMRGRHIVFVGKNVASAFGHADTKFFDWNADLYGGYFYCVVAHPSGLSRVWNDKDFVKKASEFMKRIPR